MSIYLAFVLIFFNVFTNNATRVLVTLYALKLDAQPLAIGLLAATFAIFPMLFSWHAGKITDRVGARRPITFGALVGGCCMLLPYFFPTLSALFVTAALSGVASMFYSLSNQNLVGSLSTTEKRARGYSNASMVVSVGNACGALFVGYSIDQSGHAFTFLCISGLYVVPLLVLAIWGGLLPGGQHNSAPGHGIRHTLANPQLWPVLAASGLAQASLDLFQIYVPVYGHAQGLSASEIGGVLALAAAGGFAARIVLTRLIAWFGEERLLTLALLGGAAGFAAVPFFQSAGELAMVSLLFGFGMNCSQPITLTLLYNRSPPGRAGQMLGLRFMLDNAARLAGPALFGVAVSALGLGPVFWLNALVLGAGGLVTRLDVDRGGGRTHEAGRAGARKVTAGERREM